MNITYYSNVTTKEIILKNIPEIAEDNVKFFRLSQRDELMKNAADTQILFIDAMGICDSEMIDALPNLKLIQSEGVGYQGVDVKYAAKKNIPVCNAKGVNDSAVAEIALYLMLGCLRKASQGVSELYGGTQAEFKKSCFGVCKELSQCTVGLVGFGNIAQKTAQFCSSLGARVIYSNRSEYPDIAAKYGCEYVGLDSLLEQSDIVSLHLAVTPQTENIADKKFFKKMKNTAYLINTARGDLVDNNALKAAILNGEIAGAGLDVISPEPIKKDNILLTNDLAEKLVLTPHIAGITNLTVKKIYENMRINIINAQNGTPFKNRVN